MFRDIIQMYPAMSSSPVYKTAHDLRSNGCLNHEADVWCFRDGEGVPVISPSSELVSIRPACLFDLKKTHTNILLL